MPQLDIVNHTFLMRLFSAWRIRRLRVVYQLSETDCGPAALATVLGFFGKHVELADIRAILATSRDGVDAAELLKAGRTYGLQGRGSAIGIGNVRYLPMGSILHWRDRHFVVFQRATRNYIEIVDPASGQRSIPIGELGRYFTGIVLLFQPDRSFRRGPKNYQRLRRFGKRIFQNRRLLFSIVAASILAQIATVSAPLLIRFTFDNAMPNHDTNLLAKLLLGYSALLTFEVITNIVRLRLLVHLRIRLETAVTSQFLDHLVNLPYSFFHRHTIGDLIVRLGNNGAVRDFLSSTTMSVLIDGTIISLCCLLLLHSSPRLGLVGVLFIACRIIFIVAMRSRHQACVSQALENHSRLNTYQVEMFAGMEMLKSMGLEAIAATEWTNFFIRGMKLSRQHEISSAVPEVALKALEGLGSAVFVIYAAFMVIREQLSIGAMIESGALAALLLTQVRSLTGTLLQFQTLDVYLQRFQDILDTPPHDPLRGNQLPSRLTGRLTLRGVSFRYSSQSPDVLNDVSFDVPAGSRVALVGHSGSGKSTLAKLLAGLYEPVTGVVQYDGFNLNHLERLSVRRQVGVVTQETQLFSGSIRHNIAFSNPQMEFATVILAAKLSGIHDDIMGMPMGYETSLVDRGLSLSGGQRQRLALSRALATNPAVLILDEATSYLDASTEEQIKLNVASLRCTRIVIAHRLSTIWDADMIVVLDRGRIAEVGKHADLVARAGIYSALFSGQQVSLV